MLKPIAELVSQASGRTEAELLALHRDPHLLIEPFATVIDSGFSTSQGRVGSAEGGALTAAPVRKRVDGNSFASMVTVGRAGNNDIEIPGDEVSKFHAYFTRDREGRLTITDAGSSFGTFVGDERLTHGKTVLEDGMLLRFGRVSATFHTAEGFVRYLLALGEV